MPNALIQLSICLALCLIFLIHHLERKPFTHGISNKAETFSLSLLCGIAAINLLKACFLYAELNFQGSQAEILSYLELMEGMFVILLILFIVFFESVSALAMRLKKTFGKKEPQMTHQLSGHTEPPVAQDFDPETTINRNPVSEQDNEQPDEDGVKTNI